MKNNINNKFQTRLLSFAATYTLILLSAGFAHAQTVNIAGDNGTLAKGCHAPMKVPSDCANVIDRQPLPDTVAPSLEFPYDAGDSVLIGTNGTFNNEGPAASGTATVTDGGTVTSAYLYVGFEKNTVGAVEITGPGSVWTSYSAAIIGNSGVGSLTLMNGGQYRQLQPDNFFIGYGVGGKGSVIVSGVDAETDTRSSIITKNRIYIGRDGDANLSILDGGYVSAEYTSVSALSDDVTANLIVAGVNQVKDYASTFRVVHNQFWVGDDGKGTVKVLEGGRVEIDDGILLGGEKPGSGYLYIDGVDIKSKKRSTATAQSLNVGHRGYGEGYVTNGGLVTTNDVAVGQFAGATGKLFVDGINSTTGDRSTINARDNVIVGNQGTGEASITNGGLVQTEQNVLIGNLSAGVGTLNIDGAGSEVIAAGQGNIGVSGKGTLNLTNGGSFKASSVVLATNAASNGTINIGAGGRAGILDVSTITAGLGAATVNFNHIDNIDFAPQMKGNINVNHINTGTTTLNSANDYSGSTTVKAGTLQAGGVNRFSANSKHIVELNGTLSLNGYNQTISTIQNAGLVRFGGSGGTTLNLTGAYDGNNGILEFNTVLGGDNSVTDTLTVKSTTGTSFVKVNNIGGAGAQTEQGIKIIDVKDSSAGVFTLLGDYRHQGEQAVVGGAYAYKLYKNGITDPADGDWYLRSALKDNDQTNPLYQAGVPVYEAYPQAMLALNSVNSLQERVGNRFWSGKGNRVLAQGADAIQPYATAEEAGAHVEGNGVWGRMEGGHNKIKPSFSTSNTDYNQNILKMQAGVDGLLSETENGRLIGGIYAQYVHGKTKVNSVYGDGEISTNGYGVGGTLTWYGNEGLYVDGQAQATWYKSDLSSTIANSSLANGSNGFGYTLSAETGKRFVITPEWSATPQAQLIYSNIRFDRFNDVYDAAVSLDKGDSLQTRLGVTLDHETSWQNANGLINRSHIYGLTNLYYEFLDGTQVDVAGISFASKKDRVWAGVGIGGSYNWDDEKYSIYGETIVNTSLNSFADNYSLKGNVGFRIQW